MAAAVQPIPDPVPEAEPPLRSEHTSGIAPCLLAYDRWGTRGRPVVLLHGLLVDRRMWWPLGAELAADTTVVAVDLPGHGGSPARTRIPPDVLAEELALLVESLELRRAPVVVAHSAAVVAATAFAARFAVHAVVTVDEVMLGTRTTPIDLATRISATLRIPEMLRHLATPRLDPVILAPYLRSWTGRPADQRQLRAPADRRSSDADPGAFAPLADPAGFAGDLRALL